MAFPVARLIVWISKGQHSRSCCDNMKDGSLKRFFTYSVSFAACLLTACAGYRSIAMSTQPMGCAQAAASIAAGNPVSGTTLRITTAAAQPASQTMASHCLIEGAMNERVSALDGKPYAIKLRMRLPGLWNEKLFFAGGGGSNGVVADATGPITGYAPALTRGYAVIVTDSGHDTAVDFDPAKGGSAAFGIDQPVLLDTWLVYTGEGKYRKDRRQLDERSTRL